MPVPILEALIGDVAEFKKTYWRRRPFLYRSPHPERVTELLSLDAVDDILASPATRPPYVELARKSKALRERDFVHVAGSKSLDIVDAVNTNVVAAEFEKGATVILNHPDDYHLRAQEACQAFQDEFSAYTKTVAFITPPAQQALGLHYDTFEGFIVQTHGTKKWFVYEQLNPLPSSPLGMEDDAIDGPPVVEVVLEPGDCLYMPWGSPHYAQSQDSVSCHVTVMVVPTTWTKELPELLKASIPAEADDALPFQDPNVAGSDVAVHAAAWLEHMLRNAAILDLSAELESVRQRQAFTTAARSGFLSEAAAGESLAADSRVWRVPAVSIEITNADGEWLDLKIGASVFRLPTAARDAVEQLMDADGLTVTDVSPILPDAVKVKLTRHLLRHGALALSGS